MLHRLKVAGRIIFFEPQGFEGFGDSDWLMGCGIGDPPQTTLSCAANHSEGRVDAAVIFFCAMRELRFFEVDHFGGLRRN